MKPHWQAKSLAELSEHSDFNRLINEGLVSPSPRVAVEKIETHSGEVPNRLGTNCVGIANIRNAIAELSAASTPRITNALSLVAPHTHWGPAPIIHTYDVNTDRYYVGPAQGRPPFTAVSFVFHPEGPIPYEWADGSCSLHKSDLHSIWRFVSQLNGAINKTAWFSAPYPIGVSINYRFKHPFSPAVFSTHERPVSHRDDLSCVERVTSAQNLYETHRDQVGWASSPPPDLSEADLNALSVLHDMLSSMSESESSSVMTALANR